ncbi:MAG TPA: zinc ribbon domain-containing protein [Staphylococcus ureilyticus]|uniref:TcaA second domain-containing protein n=2 Tax=Staphylococcus TaxID=1279 RepID=UPI001DD64A9E|nr:zinc ribbon domain-containing protein [Staphylococcus ureilyticus]HJG66557.1 zinc ribbon domain-containing protein [Staphylococcus ureilyticus]
MKFCRNCGAKIKNHQKNCTNCGQSLEDNKQSTKSTKKPLIIVGVIVVILILFFVLFKIIESTLSPTNQAKAVAQDLKKGNTNNLAKDLEFNGRNLNKTESKALYKYIEETDSPDRIANEIESNVKSMKDNKTGNASVSVNDTEIINIRKNGKKYGIFNNYDFTVGKQSVKIDPDSDSTIKYKYNNKNHKVKLSQDEEKVFATLPIGDYKLEAKKTVGKDTFDGYIIIKMSDDNTVSEDFKEKYLDVSINDDSIDDISKIYLYVNNKKASTYDTYEDYIYGPYKPDAKLKVYAQTTIDGKTFKTNSVQAPSLENGKKTVPIELKFDENQIEEHQKNAEIKEDVQTFIEDYTDALNEAYEEEEFSYVSSYFKSDSKAADHIEERVESGDNVEY